MTETSDQTTDDETTEDGGEFVIHFVGRGLSVPTKVNQDGRVSDTAVLGHGAELVVTPELLEASRDRFGASVFEMSEDRQVQRWGEVLFRRGPWPTGTSRHEPGSLAWLESRDRARLDVDRLPMAERPAAAAAVRAQYGAQPTTSRTINSVG